MAHLQESRNIEGARQSGMCTNVRVAQIVAYTCALTCARAYAGAHPLVHTCACACHVHAHVYTHDHAPAYGLVRRRASLQKPQEHGGCSPI